MRACKGCCKVLQGWQAQCFTQFMVVPGTRSARGFSAMQKAISVAAACGFLAVVGPVFVLHSGITSVLHPLALAGAVALQALNAPAEATKRAQVTLSLPASQRAALAALRWTPALTPAARLGSPRRRRRAAAAVRPCRPRKGKPKPNRRPKSP